MQDDDGCFAGKEEPGLTDTDNKVLPVKHSIVEETNIPNPLIPEPAIDVSWRSYSNMVGGGR